MGKWWVNYPWRVIQTNMREIDMADLDAQQFIDDLLSFHCNAVMLNAAGILASYPTKLVDHEQNRFLTGESLKTLVELCHQNGIKAIARTDFSKIRRSVFERHPEWVYRTPHGDPIDNNGSFHACITAGFQGEYMDLILEEMLSEIPFDGVYCNMGGFMTVDYNCQVYPPCHCESCRTKFRERYGFDIPDKDIPFASPEDPAVMAYQKFKQEVTAAQKARITALIHRINPDVAYCSVDYFRQESNTEYGRGLPHWQYSAASNTRTMRGMGKDATNADVDFIGFSMRHIAVSPVQQELRLWQTLANFGGPDFFVMGRLDNHRDKSAYSRVRNVFSFAEAHEDLLYGATSCAKVLLVRDSYNIPNPEERGWVRALTELHIPFDEMLTAGLSSADLQKYCLIILPDKARLSERMAEGLNAFAQAGGWIMATSRPPMAGVAPPACLGITTIEAMDTRALGAALQVLNEDRSAFPSFADRGLIPVGNNYQPVKVAQTARTYMRLLPPEPFGPPEVCYPDKAHTEYFGISMHPFGKGGGMFIPWSPASCYYTDGYDIWALFMRDILISICGAESLSENLTPMVEVTHGRKDDVDLLHFVNGTGHFGTSFFDPIELHDLTVEIPWDDVPPVCESLYTPDNATIQQIGEKLRITVKTLGFYECIVMRRKVLTEKETRT